MTMICLGLCTAKQYLTLNQEQFRMQKPEAILALATNTDQDGFNLASQIYAAQQMLKIIVHIFRGSHHPKM